MSQIFILPQQQLLDLNASPLAGAQLKFFVAGTTTPVDSFVDHTRSTRHPWPVIANSGGRFPLIYTPVVDFDVTISASDGTVIYTAANQAGDTAGSGTSASAVGRQLPVGAMIYHSGTDEPPGFKRVRRDPVALLKSSYPEYSALLASQGYPYGSTSTTFNMPGGGGLFLRVWDDASTHDPDPIARTDHATGATPVGNIIGSRQSDAIGQHTHTATATITDPGHSHVQRTGSSGSGGTLWIGNTTTNGAHTDTSSTTGTSTTGITAAVTVNNAGGSETRPDNVAYPLLVFVSPQEAAGATQAPFGLPYEWDTDTADTDQGPGHIWLNNAAPALATALYVSTVEANSATVGAVWEQYDAISGSNRGTVYVYAVSGLANMLGLRVTGDPVDRGTYWAIPIAHDASNGVLTSGAAVGVWPTFAGSGGSTGAADAADYASRSVAQTSSPALGFLRVAGFAAAGDGGDALYKQVSAPATPTLQHFQSADGQWWQFVATTVDVKAFGAVGNGTADDTAAIQAALDTGAHVYLPRGTYRTTAPLVVRSSNQDITGDGPNSAAGSVIRADAGVTPVLSLDSDVAGITLRSNNLRNVLITRAGAAGGTALLLNRAQTFSAEDVTINNHNRCVDAFGSRASTWHRTTFSAKGTGGWCLRLRGTLADFGGVAYIDVANWDCADTVGPNNEGHEADGLVLEGAVATVTGYSLQIVRARRSLDLRPGTEGPGVTANPYFVYFYDFQSDATGEHGIRVDAGTDIAIDRGWVQSARLGTGVVVGAAVDKFRYRGYVGGGAYHGLDIAGKNVHLDSLSCGRNSAVQIASGTYASPGNNTHDNVIVRSTADNVLITGGEIGRVENGTGLARYGITVEAGATDVRAIGVNLTGNVTAAINDPGGALSVIACEDVTPGSRYSGTDVVAFGNQSQSMFEVGNTSALTVANRLRATGAAAGLTPTLTATGSDVNIGMIVSAKGTGTGRLRHDAVDALTWSDTRIDAMKPVRLPTYTLATLPSAATHARSIVWVSDATPGSQQYVSDGTIWRPVPTTETIVIAASDATTALTTGTAKATLRMPFALTLTAVRASLTGASSSGLVTVDINDSGVSIFSTPLTIDATETTSVTAATPAVVADPNLADDAVITIDIDAAGTGATGLRVTLIGVRA